MHMNYSSTLNYVITLQNRYNGFKGYYPPQKHHAYRKLPHNQLSTNFNLDMNLKLGPDCKKNRKLINKVGRLTWLKSSGGWSLFLRADDKKDFLPVRRFQTDIISEKWGNFRKKFAADSPHNASEPPEAEICKHRSPLPHTTARAI